MRRLVRKLEQRNIAGVCIEDKLFPKTNSFIRGTAQPLADMEEFAGKIKAGKDAQAQDDFVIVARVEAFIAGWGLDEALRRAEYYYNAGADAILIHSSLQNPNEVLLFKKAWGNCHPVVIVPTNYYKTPTDVFREHGFSVCIWANHLMRSSLTSMRSTAQTIYKEQHLLSIEDNIVPMTEVFRIQGQPELTEAEKRYLPANAQSTSAVILAASQGAALGDLTREKPKCMVDIAGKPLLAHIIDTYRSAGIKDITAVRGYEKETVNLTGVKYVDNDDYADTQEVYSLIQAREQFQNGCIISYGDVLFKKCILSQLLDAEDDFVVMADVNWEESRNRERVADFISCSEPNSKRSFHRRVTLKELISDFDNDQIDAEWMGFLKVSKKGAEILGRKLDELCKTDVESAKTMKMPDLMRDLIQSGQDIRVIYTTGHWLDIDSVDDVLVGSTF